MVKVQGRASWLGVVAQVAGRLLPVLCVEMQGTGLWIAKLGRVEVMVLIDPLAPVVSPGPSHATVVNERAIKYRLPTEESRKR